MKKLLIVSLMLAMVLAAVPAFAQGTQWWSAPFTITMTQMTPTPTAGPTIIVSTHPKYSGNLYVGTIGDEVVEVTFCGLLGPNKDDVEIDFTELPQIATDHPNIHILPEQFVAWGFGTFNNYTTSVSGPAFFHSTGILLENSSDAITKISLIGEVKGSGGSSYPYSYLLKGAFGSFLTPLTTTPTCNGRQLP